MSEPNAARKLESSDPEFKTSIIKMPRALKDKVDMCKNRWAR